MDRKELESLTYDTIKNRKEIDFYSLCRIVNIDNELMRDILFSLVKDGKIQRRKIGEDEFIGEFFFGNLGNFFGLGSL